MSRPYKHQEKTTLISLKLPVSLRDWLKGYAYSQELPLTMTDVIYSVLSEYRRSHLHGMAGENLNKKTEEKMEEKMNEKIKKAIEFLETQQEGFLYYKRDLEYQAQEAWIHVNKITGQISFDYNETTSSSLTRDVADGVAYKLYIDSLLTNKSIAKILESEKFKELYEIILKRENSWDEIEESWEILLNNISLEFLSVLDNGTIENYN